MYKKKISSFVAAVSPFVARLKESGGDDELTLLFLSELEKLAQMDGGEAADFENAIQRQARLESLTSAIREQLQTVSFLADSNTAAASGPPPMTADFQGLHTPFIVAHLVMEWLDSSALASLAATSKNWHRRALQYVGTRARTNLLLEFVREEQLYQSDLHLGVQAYGRAMEKHGLVDKTVIFLNIPVLRKVFGVFFCIFVFCI